MVHTTAAAQPPAVPRESEFPLTSTAVEKLRFVARYAAFAPSLYNSRPWQLRIVGDELELCLDAARSLPAADPCRRQQVIGCGGALYYLILAARRFGYLLEVSTRPEPRQQTLLARARLGPRKLPSDRERSLFEAIGRSRPGGYEAPSAAFRERLQELARAEGAWLRDVGRETDASALTALLGEAGRRLLAGGAARRELTAWLRRPRDPRVDGIPRGQLGLGRLRMHLAGLPMPAAFACVALEPLLRGITDAARAPGVMALGTAGDEMRDWLSAGRALARVMLHARMEGIAAAWLCQPAEQPELRRRLAAMVGRALPHGVLLLGAGTTAPACR